MLALLALGTYFAQRETFVVIVVVAATGRIIVVVRVDFDNRSRSSRGEGSVGASGRHGAGLRFRSMQLAKMELGRQE